MRIAIVNYRYFVAGGPERYMFNIMQLLEQAGHEVVPFSIDHKLNEPTPWSRHFLPAIGQGDEVYFADMKRPSVRDRVRGFSRMVYSPDARRRFKAFLREARPDVVYILYYQNKISCAVVDAARSLGIPVVHRISDYSLLAPCSHLYDMRTGAICERCLESGPFAAVKGRCVMDSRLYSGVKALAVATQDALGMRRKVSRFVFPSSFTLAKFRDAGYDDKRLVHIPTLFNPATLRSDLEVTYEPFALYIGRIDPDKGLHTLVEAFADTDMPLKIIGFSSEPGYEERLRTSLEGRSHKIEFLGRMDFHRMQEYLARCLFTVVPSEWYDNLPNSILESYAFGKCVVATRLGSLAENVIDGRTGLLFDYRDAAHLRQTARRLFDDPELARRLGTEARAMVSEKFDAARHVAALTGLLIQVVAENKQKETSN